MSESAGKGRGSQSPPKPKKDSGGGFWGSLAEGFVSSLSRKVQSGERRNPADPASRMEPVRQDRKETGDEMIFRATEGAAGQAPMDRASRERRYVARALAGQQAAGRTTTRVPQGTGAPLPSTVRSKMEPKLGADLANVRVHNDGESAQAAKGFGARAFTVGEDVHFNAGEFNPGTKEGDKLLAHELTHVVQGQKSGIQRKEDEKPHAPEGDAGDAKGDAGDAKGDAGDAGAELSDPSEPAEKEADAVGDKLGEELHGDDKKDEKDGKKKKAKDGKDAKAGDSKDGDKADDAKADDAKADDAKADDARAGDAGAGDVKAQETPAPIAAKLEGVGRKIFLAGPTNLDRTHADQLNSPVNTLGQGQAGAPAGDDPELMALVAEADAKIKESSELIDREKLHPGLAAIEGGLRAAIAGQAPEIASKKNWVTAELGIAFYDPTKKDVGFVHAPLVHPDTGILVAFESSATTFDGLDMIITVGDAQVQRVGVLDVVMPEGKADLLTAEAALKAKIPALRTIRDNALKDAKGKAAKDDIKKQYRDSVTELKKDIQGIQDQVAGVRTTYEGYIKQGLQHKALNEAFHTHSEQGLQAIIRAMPGIFASQVAGMVPPGALVVGVTTDMHTTNSCCAICVDSMMYMSSQKAGAMGGIQGALSGAGLQVHPKFTLQQAASFSFDYSIIPKPGERAQGAADMRQPVAQTGANEIQGRQTGQPAQPRPPRR